MSNCSEDTELVVTTAVRLNDQLLQYTNYKVCMIYNIPPVQLFDPTKPAIHQTLGVAVFHLTEL